jgi:DNA repair exonuclease SbcCD nuclease subunit
MRARHAGSGAAYVREQRIVMARALAAVAKEHAVDAVLLAGDVFEDNGVDRFDVQRVIDACIGFGVPVYVLPGNHDPLVAGSVWEHTGWAHAANVTVLREACPIECAPGMMLYPAPAFAKYSTSDPTAWMSDASFDGTRVGIAHGTVQGANVDEDCFPIPRDAAVQRGLAYLALGHWHSTGYYEPEPGIVRMAYCGTHEPTKFGERDSGNVLIVDVPGREAAPILTKIPTGRLTWHQIERELGGAIDLDAVVREVEALPDPEHSLLDLRLSGTIRPVQLRELERLRDMIAARFPLLGRLDDAHLIPEPDGDAWAEALPVGLLRDVAARLRDDGGDHANAAMMLLYRYGTEAGEVNA